MSRHKAYDRRSITELILKAPTMVIAQEVWARAVAVCHGASAGTRKKWREALDQRSSRALREELAR